MIVKEGMVFTAGNITYYIKKVHKEHLYDASRLGIKSDVISMWQYNFNDNKSKYIIRGEIGPFYHICQKVAMMDKRWKKRHEG